MPDIVIIPTAGVGSRMGKLTNNVNKALLPYNAKPAIAHIIDAFPVDSHFVVPIGYLGEQVRDFLGLAYPNHNITVVEIDDFLSEKSGTATTILGCKHLIKSAFWYVSCDTIFDKNDINSANINEDICWTSPVSKKDSIRYTMFETQEKRISGVSFKEERDHSWVAFTGLMRIADFDGFIKRLESLGSTEFIHAINKGTLTGTLNSWIDIGTQELYESATRQQGFDFSKTNEYTWICNNTVIKWWKDCEVSGKKMKKAMSNVAAVPDNVRVSGAMMSYDYADGETMYQSLNDTNLDRMLSWLKTTVWKRSNLDITQDCLLFYKNKTQSRIEKIITNTKRYPVVSSINGRRVKTPDEYLGQIDWEWLSTTHVASWIHGDLQFDNIVIREDGGFLAIDWRQEFGKSIEIGDAYYDLSKLIGGCMLDYSRIKSNEFSVEFIEENVQITYPSVPDADEKIKKIKRFATENGFDPRKIDILVPIIFWNMAPLHNEPFDLLLWYLGILRFSDTFDHEKIH